VLGLCNMIDNRYIFKVFLTVKSALGLLLLFVIIRILMMPELPVDVPKPTSAHSSELKAEHGLHKQPENLQKNYSAIIKRNLFMAVDPTLQATAASQGSTSGADVRLADEILGLTLLGTICGNPQLSRAIIKNNKSNIIDLYKAGDNVASASIESINIDSVVLRINGNKKLLRLNTALSVNTSGFIESSQVGTVEQKNKHIDANALAPQPSAQEATRTDQIETVLEQADIEPYNIDGNVEGLIINGLDNLPAAMIFGLKNGDIIRTVNGQKLTSKQKAFQVFKKARTQPTINIELLRGDQLKQLSFNQH
jgi:type II secretion system protein C